MTGIIRYNSTSTDEPTSISTVVPSNSCGDEPAESLVPYLSLDVGDITSTADEFESMGFKVDSYFKWTINGSSLFLNWSDPTLTQVLDGQKVFAAAENSVVYNSTGFNQWALLIIEDDSGIG